MNDPQAAGLQARIDAAREALPAWQARPVKARARLVGALRHRLAQEADTVIAAIGERFDRGPAETLTTEIIPLADAARFIERRAARVRQVCAVAREKAGQLDGVNVSLV